MKNITFDEFEEILWDDNEDFVAVTEDNIIDQSRWTTTHERVFKQKSTNKYFKAVYERGSTEYQDMDREDMFWGIYEVEPKEVVTTVYEKVKDGINLKKVD